MSIELRMITISGLKGHDTGKGYAWTCVVHVDDAPVLQASQAGDGGCMTYYAAPGSGLSHREAQALRDEFEASCAARMGGRRESLDKLLCAMEPGMTGEMALGLLDAVDGEDEAGMYEAY